MAGFGVRRSGAGGSSALWRVLIGLSPVYLLGGFLLYDEIGARDAPQFAGSAVIEPVAAEPAGSVEQTGMDAVDGSSLSAESSPLDPGADTVPVVQASFSESETDAANVVVPPARPQEREPALAGAAPREQDGWRVAPDLGSEDGEDDRYAAAGSVVVPQPRWGSENASTDASPVPMPRARPDDLREPSVAGADDRKTVAQVPIPAPRARSIGEPEDGVSGALRQADLPPVPPVPVREQLSAVDTMQGSGSRIVIHHNAGSREARELREVLGERGLSEAEIRRVGVNVSQPSVRYFHPQDRDAAVEVNRLLRDRGYSSQLRSFTDFSPQPSRGTVEVWLPG